MAEYNCSIHDYECAPWASCLDNYFPCSETVVGNLLLMAVYGYILAKGSKILADGSELLMEILNPGFIGGFLLPVLGALPDSAIIFVSGLGGDPELVKEEISVGMGTLAGSTVMLLTVAWAGSVFVGRCNLGRDGKAIDKTLTRSHRWSLTETGVTCEDDLKINSRIMMVTALAYWLIQGIAFKHVSANTDDTTSQREEAPFALATVVVAGVAFLAYSAYMVMNTQAQARRLEAAKKKYMLDKLATMFHDNIINKEGFIVRDTQDDVSIDDDTEAGEGYHAPLLSNTDSGDSVEDEVNAHIQINAGLHRRPLGHVDSFTVSKINDDVLKVVSQWKKEINIEELEKQEAEKKEKHELEHREGADEEEEKEEEEEESSGLSKKAILIRSATMMAIGTAIVILFSSPMVDVISKFSYQIGISAFYTSFVVTPFVSNASEVIAALIFASRKRRKNISLTFGALYGAVTMNNTMCLFVFLLMVYTRKIPWIFSAEVIATVFVIFLVGGVTSYKTTFKTWYCLMVASFYPLSLGLVLLLKQVVG